MPKPVFQNNDLIVLIKDNIKLLQELDQTIKIDFIHDNNQLFFNGDKEQLSRVFLNLIKNSIESIQQKIEKVGNFNKNITIELNEFDSHISLIINDNGVGFKNLNNNIKEILNPYFTTKKEGTGLGLSIVNKIINDHNGSIEFISEEDGATIKIIFIK
jgi:two-component system nitrogen regulation sensor histidine kinase NtrY